MEGRGAGQGGQLPVVTPEIAAEAAVWVARLHGLDRSRHMERDCLAWQGRSAAHRLAFECCTDTWQEVAGIDLRSYARAAVGATASAFLEQAKTGARWPMRWAVLVNLAVLRSKATPFSRKLLPNSPQSSMLRGTLRVAIAELAQGLSPSA